MDEKMLEKFAEIIKESKPDVVLYEESLNQQVIESAIDSIASADMLVLCTYYSIKARIFQQQLVV